MGKVVESDSPPVCCLTIPVSNRVCSIRLLIHRQHKLPISGRHNNAQNTPQNPRLTLPSHRPVRTINLSDIHIKNTQADVILLTLPTINKEQIWTGKIFFFTFEILFSQYQPSIVYPQHIKRPDELTELQQRRMSALQSIRKHRSLDGSLFLTEFETQVPPPSNVYGDGYVDQLGQPNTMRYGSDPRNVNPYNPQTGLPNYNYPLG